MNPDIDELIQCEILAVKNILDLRRDIIYITNHERWAEILQSYKLKDDDLGDSYGESITKIGYIFINLHKTSNVKILKQAIFHELAHIKFPRTGEKCILKYEKKYLGD